MLARLVAHLVSADHAHEPYAADDRHEDLPRHVRERGTTSAELLPRTAGALQAAAKHSGLHRSSAPPALREAPTSSSSAALLSLPLYASFFAGQAAFFLRAAAAARKDGRLLLAWPPEPLAAPLPTDAGPALALGCEAVPVR
jgi:hypothetical protein